MGHGCAPSYDNCLIDCCVSLFVVWVMCITWAALSCTDHVAVIWSSCSGPLYGLGLSENSRSRFTGSILTYQATRAPVGAHKVVTLLEVMTCFPGAGNLFCPASHYQRGTLSKQMKTPLYGDLLCFSKNKCGRQKRFRQSYIKIYAGWSDKLSIWLRANDLFIFCTISVCWFWQVVTSCTSSVEPTICQTCSLKLSLVFCVKLATEHKPTFLRCYSALFLASKYAPELIWLSQSGDVNRLYWCDSGKWGY